MTHYYKSDVDVKKDSELQRWIKEIFCKGFLERKSTGLFSDVDRDANMIHDLDVSMGTMNSLETLNQGMALGLCCHGRGHEDLSQTEFSTNFSNVICFIIVVDVICVLSLYFMCIHSSL